MLVAAKTDATIASSRDASYARLVDPSSSLTIGGPSRDQHPVPSEARRAELAESTVDHHEPSTLQTIRVLLALDDGAESRALGVALVMAGFSVWHWDAAARRECLETGVLPRVFVGRPLLLIAQWNA